MNMHLTDPRHHAAGVPIVEVGTGPATAAYTAPLERANGDRAQRVGRCLPTRRANGFGGVAGGGAPCSPDRREA